MRSKRFATIPLVLVTAAAAALSGCADDTGTGTGSDADPPTPKEAAAKNAEIRKCFEDAGLKTSNRTQFGLFRVELDGGAGAEVIGQYNESVDVTELQEQLSSGGQYEEEQFVSSDPYLVVFDRAPTEEEQGVAEDCIS